MQSADAAYRRAVGKRIRVWRVINERSQDDLAAEAGVTRNFVSAIERGAQGLDAVRLRKLAVVMGVTLGELLADPEPAQTGAARAGAAQAGAAQAGAARAGAAQAGAAQAGAAQAGAAMGS